MDEYDFWMLMINILGQLIIPFVVLYLSMKKR